MIKSKEDEFFLNNINNYLDKAINNNVTITKFLDLRKQELIKTLKVKDVYIYFDGGYEDAEYKRCLITPFENNKIFKITKLKILYNKRYLSLTHRNVLGNLMSLGIKREMFGDIVINNDDIYILVTDEISDFLITNLTTMHGVPVELIKVEEPIKNEVSFIEKNTTVASLRLDCVLSAIYNISRNLSQDLIKKELVKINQSIITNVNHKLNENDIISIRGYGRTKLSSINGVTRKDKIAIDYLKYI